MLQDVKEWAEKRAQEWEQEARRSEADGMYLLAENARRIAQDYREGKTLPPVRD